MIPIKTPAELEPMRVACRLSAELLAEVAAQVRPGATTGEIDAFAAARMRALGVRSAFFGYGGFPGYTCLSLNDEVVHGIPGPRVINAGDLVSVDLGVVADGFVGDNALTVRVGAVDAESERLCEVTEAALAAGVAAARAGNRVGDIGHAVQTLAESQGYGVIRDLTGHGIGRSMHEDPSVPNFGEPGRGARLKAGMTLAVEPMISLGSWQVQEMEDGWTIKTLDGSPCAHYEHTIAVTESGPPEILTLPGNAWQ